MTQQTPRLACALDGYTDLPHGKLATLVTFLEMMVPPDREPATAPEGVQINPYAPDPAHYRALYRRIGEPWLWTSRLRLSDAELEALLANPDLERFTLDRDGEPVGLLELDFREQGACELAYLGLVPEETGHGHGRFLMDFAILRAFSRPISRFFVHTCHFDHPGAVRFYQRCGFSPVKLAVEIFDDPRQRGLLPREAAAHVPLLESRDA